MAVDIRLPNITKGTPTQQMEQMQSYLYQLVEQLNWALSAVESGNGTSVTAKSGAGSAPVPSATPIETFNSIKALIIKSAEIVEAYEEEMQVDFDGRYAAQSDFGEFRQETRNAISVNSQGITQALSRIEYVESDLGAFEQKINGYVRTGSDIGEEGRVGIEIGEERDIDGTKTFRKYCRLVSDRLSFFDANENEIAYVSDQQLYITAAQITTNLRIGSYMLDSSNGLAFKWEGN